MFYDSFRTASLSLSPFGKMVNIEEKSGILNFPIVSIESSIQQSLFEMKDPNVMASFLIREVAEFPNCFAIWHQNVYCNVA